MLSLSGSALLLPAGRYSSNSRIVKDCQGLSSGAGDGCQGPRSVTSGWTISHATALSRFLLPIEELGRSPSLVRGSPWSDLGQRGPGRWESQEAPRTKIGIFGEPRGGAPGLAGQRSEAYPPVHTHLFWQEGVVNRLREFCRLPL